MVKNVNAAGQYGNSQFTVSATRGEAAFTTIAEAITAASAVSGSVYVFPGSYTESLAFPANVSVTGASSGEDKFDVIITGNQTFTGEYAGNEHLSLRNINFKATTGNTWTQSASTASSTLEFQDCKIESTAGKGVFTGTAGANFSTLYIRSTSIQALNQCIDATGNSIVQSDLSVLNTSTDNINCIDLAGGSSLNISLSNLNTSGIGTGSCVALNSATNSVDSSNTRYNAGNATTASAFEFTIAGGFIRTTKDEMFIAGGMHWARSTGAFGTLSYGSTIINTGTTDLIDPQITSTQLDTLVPYEGITWSDQGASTTVSSNTGSVSTAAIALTLPASPSNGDTCSFIIGVALALTVTANAGHTIRLGNTVSAAAGPAISRFLGNSLTLIYNTTLNSWIAQSAIGNWVI